MFDVLQRRIGAEPNKFTLRYTKSDVQDLMARGCQLGLDDKVIEDLMFTGSRASKPISAAELIRQMENYALDVRPRGYPYRFDNPESFERFRIRLLEGLQQVGLPTNDVRIQGSSLRNPNAVALDGMSREELVTLADQIRQDDINQTGSFNAVARTFANAFHSRKIRPEDVPGLKAIKRQIEAKSGEMDVSIMSHGGNSDMDPTMRL